MGQTGFFNLSHRYDALDHKHDPLKLLARLVPRENFRPQPKAAPATHGVHTPDSARKSWTARKKRDEVLRRRVGRPIGVGDKAVVWCLL